MNHKEMNKAISRLLGESDRYDVRRELRILHSGLSREDAEAYLARYTDDGEAFNSWEYTITSAVPEAYSEDVNLALYAARRIAERNQRTFVLSLEDGEWVAAFGDWANCAEYRGGHPAYVSCMSVLQFMGKA